MSKEYLCLNLPEYLKEDIKSYIKGSEENSPLWDCLWCELYGSINSAFWDDEITGEQAEYLRSKYLFGEQEDV